MCLGRHQQRFLPGQWGLDWTPPDDFISAPCRVYSLFIEKAPSSCTLEVQTDIEPSEQHLKQLTVRFGWLDDEHIRRLPSEYHGNHLGLISIWRTYANGDAGAMSSCEEEAYIPSSAWAVHLCVVRSCYLVIYWNLAYEMYVSFEWQYGYAVYGIRMEDAEMHSSSLTLSFPAALKEICVEMPSPLSC